MACSHVAVPYNSQADDEYMISDYDLLISKFISVPKSYSSFNPGALAAGIVRGMLDSAGFPARCGRAACRCHASQCAGNNICHMAHAS